MFQPKLNVNSKSVSPLSSVASSSSLGIATPKEDPPIPRATYQPKEAPKLQPSKVPEKEIPMKQSPKEQPRVTFGNPQPTKKSVIKQVAKVDEHRKWNSSTKTSKPAKF